MKKSLFTGGFFRGIMGELKIIPGSSMVEQEAVNFEVAGSSPVPGANLEFENGWSAMVVHFC